jgi:hypothetical protein
MNITSSVVAVGSVDVEVNVLTNAVVVPPSLLHET